MPSNWLVFDRIRALARQSRIYQAERVFQDQTSLDRLTAGGEFLDFNVQAAILDQTNLQINRLERYKDYEQMDQTGEINLALDLYADEASLVDPERKHTIIIRARNRRLKRELEDLFFDQLLWDTYCRPSIRYLCKFGDLPFEVILTPNRDSVASLRFMNVYNFTRIETRYGDLVGFFHQDAIYPRPQFMHPWQVMHMRLTSFENIYHPYGRSILDGGRKAFKQLRLMEDAALIYRITRAPEKRKFTIPVGLIPPKEVPEYMQMIARNFKRQRFYNPGTGTFDERYSPLIQEDDFFMPRRPDGSGPDVDTLPGAENLDQIADIEYFKKKMVAPTKVPFERVGIGEGGGKANEKSLSQSHSEFAKAVQWVQREMATALKKVAIIHLALRGYPVEDMKGFDIALSATSAMEDLYRIETWQTRVGVMADLKDLGWFPKEWIVTHFTDLSPDEIEELKDMETTESQGGPGGGSPGGLDLPPEEGAEGEEGMEGIPGEEPPQHPNEEEPGNPIPPPPGVESRNKNKHTILESQRKKRREKARQRMVVEGFDYESERALMQELRRQGNRSEALQIMKKWANKIGKAETEDVLLNSGFTHLLESKEFDGLTVDQPTQTGEAFEPTGAGLLVEWSVPKDVRDEAIKETYDVLTAGTTESETPDSDEITEHDIPIASVSSL